MQKKLIAPIFAAALLLSNGITAFAAPEVINVNGSPAAFDDEYYASAAPTEPVQKKKIKFMTETRSDGLVLNYEYDEYGYLLMKTCRGGLFDTHVYTKFYIYDEHGNVSTETIFYPHSPIETNTFTYTYDNEGNVLTKIRRSNMHDYYNIYEYEYDEYGNVLTETDSVVDGDQIFPSAHAYAYDGYGNVLTEVAFSPNRSADCYTTAYTYTYDSEGNVLAKTSNRTANYDPPYVISESTTYMVFTSYTVTASMTYSYTFF